MRTSQGSDDIQADDAGIARASIGGRLRAAREQRDLDIEAIAGELHLDAVIIEALENDDSAALPAPIFVQGYLRSYARLLELPEDEIVGNYTAQSAEPPPLSVIRVDSAPRFRHLPSLRLVRNVVLLLLALVLVWQAWPFAERYLEGRGQPAAEQTPDFLALPPVDQ